MRRRISDKRLFIMILLCASGLCTLQFSHGGDKTTEIQTGRPPRPQYDKNGELKFPADFRRWIFVGASLGLSYSQHAPYKDEQKFTNVYITPAAYEQYEKTGEFPEQTILAMAVYRQNRKQPHGDLKLQGSFEGEMLAVEVAVKDTQRFSDGWSYFDFSPQEGQTKLRKTAKPFATNKCFDCHAQHAADDNVFVQYYPVLRRLTKRKPVK